MRKFSISTSIIISTLMLAGCATTSETMKAEGYPASYADGFEDGCHSGSKAGGSYFDQFKKDVKRFNSDKEYAQGWSDSYRQCETQQEALDRQTRMNIEWQKMDNDRKSDLNHTALDAVKNVDTSNMKYLKKK
ncbi:hypothetical protein [Shewanella sp. 0m-4]